ncbi:MAG: flavodoxin [Selenomonadaceae bacterium]|nr:flavodoxin [Selenomonadaceae bacterium]
MKKIFISILSLVMLLFFTACGNTAENKSRTSHEKSIIATKDAEGKMQNKILVVYFSRTGDNYEVGNIEKGNTHIMADIIAEAVGADTFEIKPVKSYPANYRECTEVAKQELSADARPAIEGKVTNWQDYDTVFLGYPIWWSELPMPVYTFLESYDWNGKTIIPFCTSAGDVLTGKEDNIPKYAKGAKLREGLGIRGKRLQENQDGVKPDIVAWLKKLGYIK